MWVSTEVQRASDCVVTGGKGESVVDGPAVVGALPGLGRSVAGSSRRTASRRAASVANSPSDRKFAIGGGGGRACRGGRGRASRRAVTGHDERDADRGHEGQRQEHQQVATEPRVSPLRGIAHPVTPSSAMRTWPSGARRVIHTSTAWPLVLPRLTSVRPAWMAAFVATGLPHDASVVPGRWSVT